jgi:hypothetical protein
MGRTATVVLAAFAESFFTIPANAASTTVAVRSPSTADVPDRLRVQVAALRLPTETRERGFRWAVADRGPPGHQPCPRR